MNQHRGCVLKQSDCHHPEVDSFPITACPEMFYYLYAYFCCDKDTGYAL